MSLPGASEEGAERLQPQLTSFSLGNQSIEQAAASHLHLSPVSPAWVQLATPGQGGTMPLKMPSCPLLLSRAFFPTLSTQ